MLAGPGAAREHNWVYVENKEFLSYGILHASQYKLNEKYVPEIQIEITITRDSKLFIKIVFLNYCHEYTNKLYKSKSKYYPAMVLRNSQINKKFTN